MTVRRGDMRALARPAAAALILLGAQWVDASDADGPVHRIYHYFDPSDGGQAGRAAEIHLLTRDLPGVEWTAVTPLPARVPGMAAASLADLLSDPSTPPSVLPWLRARPQAAAGHLLVERRGEIFSGPAARALEVIAEAGLGPGPGVSTDIDVTTWGKVKDLFQ